MNMREFIFGTFIYQYQLIKQNRKTLSLTVTPALDIIVKCPEKAEDERVENFLQKKWFWLEKQLSFFKKYKRKIYEKEYISGESCRYLGRQYKLVIKKSNKEDVALTKGQLILHTKKSASNTRHNKKLIGAWFTEKTKLVFQDRLIETLSQFDYKDAPRLLVRDMRRRWGSYLNQHIIILNPRLIHTSKDCIDYVITHELCHIKYRNHNKKFYNLLRQKYPKWEQAKEKLETIGSMV